MNNKIIGKWSESVSDEDKRVGMQVHLLELCIERDSLNEWVFDRGENLWYYKFFMCHIVNMYLCILFYWIILMF